jgi:hypothetical protein
MSRESFLALPGSSAGELIRSGSPQPPDESPLRALIEAAIPIFLRPIACCARGLSLEFAFVLGFLLGFSVIPAEVARLFLSREFCAPGPAADGALATGTPQRSRWNDLFTL